MARKRQNRKKLIPIVHITECATPERCQKPGGVITEVIARDVSGKALMKRQRVRVECMLDYYYYASRLNEAQYKAGLKFREFYLRIRFDKNCLSSRKAFVKEAGLFNPDGKMLDRLEYLRLLDGAHKQLSPEQWEVIRKVCGYDEYAGNYAKLKTFRRGLDILVTYWGYG